MGIPISEYIGISTKVVNPGTTSVNFSALVFSKVAMKSGVSSTDQKVVDYNAGKVITLSKDSIADYFDATGAVAKFASKYFGWDGGTATPQYINLCKVLTTPVAALNGAVAEFTDFGTYTFLGEYGSDGDFDYEDVLEAAQAGNNTGYRIAVPCATTDYDDVCEMFDGLNAFVVECSDIGASGAADAGVNYGAYTYCTWFASVNYDAINSADSIDFKPFGGLAATVNSAEGKHEHDAVKCNYIGEVQARGIHRKFMQPGVLMNGNDAGVDRDAVWMQTLIEIGWLDLVTKTKVPASYVGAAMVKNLVVSVAKRGIDAGAILVEKVFADDVRAQIDQYANVEGAADQVEAAGYFVSTRIIPEKVNDVTRYKIEYTLIFGKSDHVAKVGGVHILV